ncbi:diacylglycerol kinase [Coprothermobacteraceae bacterium]|nr:diacylglycerol kinase [Coprothermobacteraceae bacterium]
MIDSFLVAIRGIAQSFGAEYHVRVALVIMLAVVIYGAFLRLNFGEWVAVGTLGALVVGFELMNSALERLADVVHPEWSEGIGLAKDLAAASVLLVIVGAGATGFAIFTAAFSRQYGVSLLYAAVANMVLAVIGISTILVMDSRRLLR